MTDQVFFEDLLVKTRIGVTAEERSRPQTVRISVTAAADLAGAGKSDALADTVDYGGVVQAVAGLVEGSEFALLERLAEEIATLVLGFGGVSAVTVKLIKEDPPVTEDVGQVGVEITRAGG